MDTLIAKHALTLDESNLEQTIAPFDIDPLTASLRVVISRPTSVPAVTWDEDTQIAVTLGVEIDGEIYKCEGSATGGYRGDTFAYYAIQYNLPTGYFGTIRDVQQRLGETKTSTFRAFATFEMVKGNPVATDVILQSVVSEAPKIPSHNSVGFNACTSGGETSGDATYSLSHTAAGSNRAVFIAVNTSTNVGTPWSSTPPTYNGNSSTEIWDANDGTIFAPTSAGNYLKEASVPTGAQTVSSTVTGGTDLLEQVVTVVSFTGCDQTTTIGNFNTDTGTDPSVTLTSVNADDMCVDNLISALASTDPTVGAGQVEQTNMAVDTATPSAIRGSTQVGTNGGVMSWTITNSYIMYGAVVFKSLAAGGIAIPVITRQFRERWG